VEGDSVANHELVNAARIAKMEKESFMRDAAIGNAAIQVFMQKRAYRDAQMRTRMFAAPVEMKSNILEM
jgi:hypothetical protein